jgi:hypothetical protein
MDVLRQLAWWGMAYGSIACLWMTAQVKADLRGQPESSDESIVIVEYGPAGMLALVQADSSTPPDQTILSGAANVDAAFPAGN